jgi:hypothetical protein
MRQYISHIVFLILLVLVTIYLLQFRKGTTLDRRQMDFAISRPGLVTEIKIEADNGTVKLERKNGRWILNSEHEAREKAVGLMLQTLSRLRVVSPAPTAIATELAEKFRDEALRLEIQTGKKRDAWLIYSESQNSPTYMLKQGASQAFIVEVLGFNGHVASLFVPDEDWWRPDILFNYHIHEIAEVTVQHRDNARQSFMLRQSPDRVLSLYTWPGGQPINEFSDSLAIRFLANFFHITHERLALPDEFMLVDSLAGEHPDHIVTVTDFGGSRKEVRLHRIMKGISEDGTPEYDIFRLYAIRGDDAGMAVVSYLSFDLVLREASYFSRGR